MRGRPGELQQFNPQLTADRRCGFVKRTQSDAAVVRIEQPIESRSTGVHALSHLGLCDVLILHPGLYLTSQNTLDSAGGCFLVDPLFAEPAIEG